MRSVTLNNGVTMPILGFGVYQIADLAECEYSVIDALATGCRLPDSAAFYGNEEAIGRAVKNSGIPRKDIVITAKLWLGNAA